MTTVARTLLDLAEVRNARDLERACERAEVLQLLDLRGVEDVLARAAGRHGTPTLRAALRSYPLLDRFTRSELERRFLALCAAAGLPRPQVNAWIALDGDGFEVDFSWPAQRLIVEADGHATHGTRAAFERDRRRDQRLIVAGWRVLRCTWRQVVREPDALVATLRDVLVSTGLGAFASEPRTRRPRALPGSAGRRAG